MSENAVMMGHGRKDLVKTCLPMKHTAAGHRVLLWILSFAYLSGGNVWWWATTHHVYGDEAIVSRR